MKDKKSNERRRKLLKSIAAGSGAIVAGKSLPESWSRPVVDSVMLPAHAETSPQTPIPIVCGPSSLTASSVYFSVDVNTGACALSSTPVPDPDGAMRLDPAGGGNISINVNISQWTVIAGGTSIDGNNPEGAQSIALRSDVSSNNFLLSFTALDGATVAVSSATVQVL
jgi:hypothetical protein